jgi:hypothetical protein
MQLIGITHSQCLETLFQTKLYLVIILSLQVVEAVVLLVVAVVLVDFAQQLEQLVVAVLLNLLSQ